MEKYCTDCVHYWRGEFASVCANPQFRHPTGRWQDLEYVRMSEDLCGVEGRGYSERKKKPRRPRFSFWAWLLGIRQVDGEA